MPRKCLAVCAIALASGPTAGRAAEPALAAPAQAPLVQAEARRFAGARWHLAYEDRPGLHAFAVQEVHRVVQGLVPYVVGVARGATNLPREDSAVLLGTSEENPEIRTLIAQGVVRPPGRAQGYTMTTITRGREAGRLVVIAGFDDAGVAYGAVELGKRLLAIPRETSNGAPRAPLAELGELRIEDAPAIETRGVWTWGYTIYDYPRFLDNLVRLKFNKVVVWNDVPPRNARDFIAYAHARGIRVVFGFQWGWGLKDLDPNNPAHKDAVKRRVLETYTTQLRGLGLDGIYFQTFTETNQTKLGGRTLAAVCREWITDISAALWAVDPSLKIEAGLHASSVRNHLDDLRSLDARVQIVWEDAGTMPWSYDPLPVLPKGKVPTEWNSPAGTLAYAKRLATLRPGGEFQMVAKGWITLRWKSEFEHHGDFLIGMRSPDFVRAREVERRSRWDYVNAQWLQHWPVARDFFAELRKASAQPLTVLTLVEDGPLEARIEPSVALGAELLWQPNRSPTEILEAAMSPYFRSMQP